MNPLYEFDDIDDYIQDRMSASDRAAFEQALETDADLVQRVEALKEESKVLRMLRNEHLLAQLDDWSKEEGPDEKKTDATDGGEKPRAIPRSRIIMAVVAILLVGITAVWMKYSAVEPKPVLEKSPDVPMVQPDTPALKPAIPDPPFAQEPSKPPKEDVIPKPNTSHEYDALAANSYLEEDFSQTLMGTEEDETELRYDQAVKKYNAKQYREALKLLEKPGKGRASEFRYLRGYVYYHLGQYAKAEKEFRAFRDLAGSDRKLDAIWCEVFCMAKQLPGSRARLDAVLLEITAKKSHPYYDKALAMQEALAKK